MERQSSHRSWIVLGGCVVSVIAVVGALLLRSGGDPAVGGSEAVATSSPVAVQPPQETSSGAPKSRAPAAVPPMIAQPTPDLPALMPGEIIEQVLKEDKKLGNFMYYHKHVLLDEPRRDEYRKLLSDPELMKAIAKDLRDPGQGEVEPKEHYHRLMQNDYFEAALDWKDNPQRQVVIDTVKSVILEDNFSTGQSVDRKQMLAGGKMELYRMMYEADVSQALDLVAQAKGTPMEDLTTWMAEENLRRRAKEEQVRAEMQEMQTKAPESANP
jgi:hypothetical protein